jgi:hypothetical protein
MEAPPESVLQSHPVPSTLVPMPDLWLTNRDRPHSTLPPPAPADVHCGPPAADHSHPADLCGIGYSRLPHSRLLPVTASWLPPAVTAPGTAFLYLLLALQARPLYSLVLDSVIPHNAGIAGPTGAIEDIDPKEWRRCIEVDLTAQYFGHRG